MGIPLQRPRTCTSRCIASALLERAEREPFSHDGAQLWMLSVHHALRRYDERSREVPIRGRVLAGEDTAPCNKYSRRRIKK